MQLQMQIVLKLLVCVRNCQCIRACSSNLEPAAVAVQ